MGNTEPTQTITTDLGILCEIREERLVCVIAAAPSVDQRPHIFVRDVTIGPEHVVDSGIGRTMVSRNAYRRSHGRMGCDNWDVFDGHCKRNGGFYASAFRWWLVIRCVLVLGTTVLALSTGRTVAMPAALATLRATIGRAATHVAVRAWRFALTAKHAHSLGSIP